jgi:GNAT superfamily N-acetyltransferase
MASAVPVPIISARAWRIRVVKRESFHPLERVDEHSLPELLPLARDYCEFNGVNPSNDELLGVFRALTADSEHEGVQFLARDRHGRPAGFATLFWTWGTWATGRIGILGDLYVATHARGTGIGEALIEACRIECRAHGARGLTWSTAKDNARARALYERVGARSRVDGVDYWLDT